MCSNALANVFVVRGQSDDIKGEREREQERRSLREGDLRDSHDKARHESC